MLKAEATARRDAVMNDTNALAVAVTAWEDGVLDDLNPEKAPLFGRRRKVILVEINYAVQIQDRAEYKAIHRVGSVGVWFRSRRNPDPEITLRMIPWTQITSIVLREKTVAPAP